MICLTPKPNQKYSEIIGVSIKKLQLMPEHPSSPDSKSLDYAIWGVLENKPNATSHPNIGSLKTAIEEE